MSVRACACVCLRTSVSTGFCPAVWDCERESSVKDTIRQGVKGRGGEEWMFGRERMCREGKERKQSEGIRKKTVSLRGFLFAFLAA